MTAPIYFLAACVAAVVVGVAHFIVLREPPGERLPTARFVPIGPSIVRSFTPVPTDRWLLASRIAAVLLIGLAFARPHLPRRRAPLVTIVAVDRSRAVQDPREAADSARRVLNGAARATAHGMAPSTSVLIPFDTAAAIVSGPTGGDTLSRLRRSDARGSLTSALVSALRVASGWRDRADSIALTIVSPVRADEVNAALTSVRALWPGTVRLIRIAAQPPTPAVGRSPAIDWPRDGHVAGASRRTGIDTVGALVLGDLVVARPFERRWAPDTTGARVIGRWVDGAPAVVERATATGCSRAVAAGIDTGRGLVRDPDLAQLVRTIHAPCAASVGAEMRALPPDLWPSTNGALRVAAAAIPATSVESNRLSWLLLALALVLVVIEMGIRARRGALRAA